MPLQSFPRVTVIMPVYNGRQYVGDSIESILRQTYTDFELIVIDDGSSDGTGEVIRSYPDHRIRLVCHEMNLGIPRTRNVGVRLAQGEYVAFLDSDDVAYRNRLERQVAFLDSHSDFAGVGAWASWMDCDGRPLRRVKRRPISSREIAALAILQTGIENSASMARTTVLRDYPHNEKLDLGSDYELWARIARRYKLSNLPEVLVQRRDHRQQTTKVKADSARLVLQTVHADQLSYLGVAFTAEDLERHSLLRGMQKRGFMPTSNYVDWAERWLYRLKDANHQAMKYPEPEFSHLLSKLWLKVCWHARPNFRLSLWLSLVALALSPTTSRRMQMRVGPSDMPTDAKL